MTYDLGIKQNIPKNLTYEDSRMECIQNTEMFQVNQPIRVQPEVEKGDWVECDTVKLRWKCSTT